MAGRAEAQQRKRENGGAAVEDSSDGPRVVLQELWKDVQEAASSVREGAAGRGAEAGGGVRAAVQEGAVEGAVRAHLALTVENFLERRLQTLVFKSGMAKSIHHARVLIKQRHIRAGRQVVNIPSFLVRVDSQKHVDFSLTSPLGGGRPGRVKRRNQRAAAKKAAGGDGDDED